MDFLTTQDLSLEPSEILTIDNFKNFSILYDRNIYLDNTNNEDNIIKILKLRNKIRNFE